jgi:hypothetical protein
MMPALVAEDPLRLDAVIAWMSRLAGVAALINALELLCMQPLFTDRGIWGADVLASEWGVLRPMMGARVFAVLCLVQVLAAGGLMVTGTGAFAALLCGTTLLMAVRLRGNVNGGSDAMLFAVLGGLAVAGLGSGNVRVREAGVLYVAVQLTLSYVRAGLVKVREPGWWDGQSLAGFLSLRAYGVPPWVPRQRGLLTIVGMGVLAFELASPVAWLSPGVCALFVVIALCFHAATAIAFGLNRFLLAWGAAMPALWYAAHRGA